MQLKQYDTSTRTVATVVDTERITPPAADEVREIVLDVDPEDFDVQAGQNIGVLAPPDPAFGHEHHFRLYSVADVPEQVGGRLRIVICVRRCSYIDPYSGERYDGVASNYLCNLRPGAKVTLTGPYGLAFDVPPEPDATLILIGAGTGIAPFRALVKHIYKNVPEFHGQVRLFHGARSGLDLLYRNRERDDFAQFYDHATFEAIDALSPRPDWTDAIDWRGPMEARGAELWQMLGDPKTYVYVAGVASILEGLDAVFTRIAGSAEAWKRRKAELQAGRRWVELVY